MEETRTTNPQTQMQKAVWYQALSLRERMVSFAAYTPPSTTVQDTERAAQRLRSWKTQRPFDQENYFSSRLLVDVLSEDNLLLLLAEHPSALRERHLRMFPRPAWMAALFEAFKDYSDDKGELPYNLLEDSQSTAFYLKPLAPLIRRGFALFVKDIQALSRQKPVCPFDPQQVAQVFLKNLLEQLLSRWSKTFVLELHVARVQQLLIGETPQERFVDFVRQLSQEEKVLALLEEYPVLARQLVITIEHWGNYALEFLTHLCNDWSDICALFAPGQEPGSLVNVEGGVGDAHRKCRSVLVLTFQSGLHILYKPKSLAVDMHFQELLLWLNAHGAEPAFRALKLLDRGEYGWSEFIQMQGCESGDEVARFYERQGSYLALLYALNAIDIHGENLIACGEHPILVDLEALFHPQVGGDDPTQPYYLGMVALDRSVFRVGLLPHRIWSNKDTAGVDLSGFGSPEGQMSPQALPRWDSSGTDQMKLVRRHIEIQALKNRPTLNGAPVNILDYKNSIIAGFTRMYQLLYTCKAELISDVLPRFAYDKIRIVLRPTQRYAMLLAESFHPDLLRDGLERERYFDHLWREVEVRPYFTRVIPAESADLLNGDIPMFTTYPSSRAIFTSEGEPLLDFFDEPSMGLVKQRLLMLNEQDLHRQAWIIEATLATLLIGPERVMGKSFKVKPSRQPASQARLIKAAEVVGQRLELLATYNDYGASWLGVSTIDENSWSLLPTDTDLYGGTSGISLFFGYLGSLTGEKRYTTLARLALKSVRSQIELQQRYAKTLNMGVFDGIGSAIYLLMHLGVLWKEPDLLREAETLVELLPALIERDEQYDIISGSAGCILNLLGLHALRPSPSILAVALQCGEHLLAHKLVQQKGVAWITIKHEKPLGGFAHGTAGIALSLLKLAEINGQEKYRQLALEALAYDRSLYLPEKRNWADLRTFPALLALAQKKGKAESEKERQGQMVAWCHGAAGIGLSRLGMQPYLDDSTFREEIEVALGKIMTHGLGENHSLCHGALGNIDALLIGSQRVDRYRPWLEEAASMALDSIDESGWVSGVPLGVETPGLLTGLAGIGYELLRLARPKEVPSVLLVEPPINGSLTSL